MVNIYGNCTRLARRLSECEWEIKRVVTNFRVIDNKLETINRSIYLESGEKIMFNTDTSEVRIRNG